MMPVLFTITIINNYVKIINCKFPTLVFHNLLCLLEFDYFKRFQTIIQFTLSPASRMKRLLEKTKDNVILDCRTKANEQHNHNIS